MPYINELRKDELEGLLPHGSLRNFSPGDLNYLITKFLLATNPTRYSDYNELVGVLECCKLEFYRRAVSAYEDEKIKQNGDVYA